MKEKRKGQDGKLAEPAATIIPFSMLDLYGKNPRIDVKGEDWEEFLESIRQRGVLVPLLARPKGKRFEVVAGKRRYTAVGVLATEDPKNKEYPMPVVVKEMDDETALEISIIENLHSKALTELEEAKAFKAYIGKKGPEAIPELAEKISKDARYIRRRLAVLNLPETILKDWDAGLIGFGHLEQYMRLSSPEEILQIHEDETLSNVDWLGSGISVENLKRVINSGNPLLSTAKFDRKRAGCHVCDKNSEVQKELFGDPAATKKAFCLDSKCFRNHQGDHLTKYWKQTAIAKEQQTNGFRFADALPVGTYEMIFEKVKKTCLSCENFISLINLDGSARSKRPACLNPSCLHQLRGEKSKGKQAAGQKSEDQGPRVAWHGEYFREAFFQTAIPEILSDKKPEDDTTIKTALVSLLSSNRSLHVWFAEKHNVPGFPKEQEEREFWGMENDFIVKTVFNLKKDQVLEDLKEGSEAVIMGRSFGAWGRRQLADTLGIDLKKQWRLTKEYLQKKTVSEILEIAGPVLNDKKALGFMETTLNVKGGTKPKNLKKGELIRVVMESGVDLSGIVPAEILS